MSVIIDQHFIDTKTVSRDSRGRVAIGAKGDTKLYQMSQNSVGQILLSPVVQVAAHEAWLLNNPEAMAALRRGLEDVAAGRVHDMGSFAEFADLPIDDE